MKVMMFMQEHYFLNCVIQIIINIAEEEGKTII